MAFYDSSLLPILLLAAALGVSIAGAAPSPSRLARGDSDIPIDSIPTDPGPGLFDMADVHGHPNLFFPQGGYLVRYPLSGPGARIADTSLIASATDGLYRLDKEMRIAEDGSGPLRIRILETGHAFDGVFRIRGDTVFTAEGGFESTERFIRM